MSTPSVAAPKRALPVATPETQHFWAGTAAGELRLQRCRECGDAYFPPQPWCPHCASDDVEVFVASGEATLYSYVISHLPAPGFAVPYVLAVVTLAEGPRLRSAILTLSSGNTRQAHIWPNETFRTW